MRTLSLWAVVALAGHAHAQSTLYVDPKLGIDQPLGGGATNPLKTITYAVGIAAQPATIHLRPGVYDTASGESFPITLPDFCTIDSDPALTAPGARLARIVTTLALATTFAITPAANAQVTLRNLELSGGAFRAVQMTVATAASLSFLVIDDCEITQSRCIVVNVNAAATADLRVLDSRLNGPDRPISTSVSAGAALAISLDRTTVAVGLNSGIALDASGGGSILAWLRACEVTGQAKNGILATSDNAGPVLTRIEHCLFWGIATRVIGGGAGLGAIVDSLGAAGTPPLHFVFNSVFANNKADAPGGTTASYTWGKNLVSQASLATLGGNVLGAPTFVNAAKSDFHLAPGSLGVDLGNPGEVSLAQDRDREPRLSPFGGAGPDLGPDETALGAVLTSDDARLGTTHALRATWSPGVAFALVLGTARVPGSFGPGAVHLTGQLFDVGLTGTTGGTGVGEVAVPIPGDPALLGLVVYWQGVFAQTPWLGANAWRTVVRP